MRLTNDTGAVWFESGRLGAQVQAVADNAVLPDLRGYRATASQRTGVDRKAAGRRAAYRPLHRARKLTLTGPESGSGWRITYQVTERPKAPVTVTAGGKALNLNQQLAVALRARAGARWF